MKGTKIVSIILSILCIALIFSNQTTFAVEGLESIGLQESKTLLEENNLELRSLKRQLELQEIILEETNTEARLWKSRIRDDEDKIKENAIKVYVDPVKEENKLASLKRKYDDKFFSLTIDLQQIYVDVVNLNNRLISLNKNLDIAEKVLEQKKTEANIGLISESEILKYETNIKEAERNIKQVENDYQLKLISFNNMITGATEVVYQPLVKDVENLITADYIDISTISIDQLVENQIKNSDTYQGYIELLKEYEQLLYVERNYTTSGAATTKTLQSIDDTEYKIKDFKHKTRTSILMSYYELLNKQLDIKIAKNSLTIAERKLKATETKYNLDLVSSTELSKDQLNYINMEQAYVEALNSYDIAYVSYLRYY